MTSGCEWDRLRGKRIVVVGGSGFLGLGLVEWLLGPGAVVTVLSRSRPSLAGVTHVGWDGRTTGEWAASLDGADAVVNLAGRTVNCIKTPDHNDEILRSRVESTRVLGEAMKRIADRGGRVPTVWVQASTAHIYGDPPTAVCDETSAFGTGLAPEVATAWEAALADSLLPKQREVRLRTSFVIGRDRGAGGSALAVLSRLARFGLGGRAGHGRQGFSWLHEEDFCRIVGRALLDGSMHGPYVVSSPTPVSQTKFMRTLRAVVGMPIGLPAPAWLVRLGAKLMLRTDPELVLYGRYVVPRRLLDEGFDFQWPELEGAFRDLLDR